jgi:hypothetical protein
MGEGVRNKNVDGSGRAAVAHLQLKANVWQRRPPLIRRDS